MHKHHSKFTMLNGDKSLEPPGGLLGSDGTGYNKLGWILQKSNDQRLGLCFTV